MKNSYGKLFVLASFVDNVEALLYILMCLRYMIQCTVLGSLHHYIITVKKYEESIFNTKDVL